MQGWCMWFRIGWVTEKEMRASCMDHMDITRQLLDHRVTVSVGGHSELACGDSITVPT